MVLVLRAFSLIFCFTILACNTTSYSNKKSMRIVIEDSVEDFEKSNEKPIDISSVSEQNSLENGSVSTMTLVGSDLWIGKLGGALIRHNLYTNDSTKFQSNNYSILDYSIKKIINSNQYIYALQTNRILRIDNTTNDLIVIPFPENITRASDIVEHTSGIYISTLGHGLWRFDSIKSTFTKVDIDLDFISSLHILNNDLYIGSMRYGLFTLNLTKNKIRSRLKYPHQLFKKNITHLSNKGTDILIGTSKNGLIKWNEKKNTISRLHPDKPVSFIFSRNNVTAISFIGYGVYIESNNANIFESIKSNLKTNNITSLAIFNDSLITGNLKKGVIKQSMELLQ